MFDFRMYRKECDFRQSTSIVEQNKAKKKLETLWNEKRDEQRHLESIYASAKSFKFDTNFDWLSFLLLYRVTKISTENYTQIKSSAD